MFLTDRTRAILAPVAVVVLVAACGSSAGASASPQAATVAPTTTAAPSTAATTPAPSEAAEAYEIDVVQGGLGKYLTGEDGKALYLFTKDSANTSTCTGDCATTWPPFTLDDGETATAGTGVLGTIGTITRPDGTTQVAINGLPLYYFSGDTKAGDTNGQGIGHVWWLASPAGTFVGM